MAAIPPRLFFAVISVTGSPGYHSLDPPGRPMTSKSALAPLIAILVLAPGAHGQANYKRDIPDSLAAKAKVTESAAAATAQKRFPKGAIQGVELEREDGPRNK